MIHFKSKQIDKPDALINNSWCDATSPRSKVKQWRRWVSCARAPDTTKLYNMIDPGDASCDWITANGRELANTEKTKEHRQLTKEFNEEIIGAGRAAAKCNLSDS